MEATIPPSPKLDISMLEDTPEYKTADDSVKKLAGAIKEYKDAIQKLMASVKAWNWNDSVSRLYAEIFTAPLLIDCGKDREEILKDLDMRTRHLLPPGYKDKNKDDKGIGDLLIWHSILNVGLKTDRDVIFVTDDEKADWAVRNDKEALFPRYELVNEFFRTTRKHFCSVNFAKFISLNGAKGQTVIEVESAVKQNNISEPKKEPQSDPRLREKARVKLAMNNALSLISQSKIGACDPDEVQYTIGELSTAKVGGPYMMGWGQTVRHLMSELQKVIDGRTPNGSRAEGPK